MPNQYTRLSVTCRVEDCDRTHYARGYCRTHYQRMWRSGTTDLHPRLRPELLIQRFWSKVNKGGSIPSYRPDLGPCWEWLGTRNDKGYGQFKVGPKQQVPAHRFVYELLIGTIPPGLEMDHLCRNPSCVNPNHLEPVTKRENILRGTNPASMNARKTHCKYGHEFTPDNTHLSSDGRVCRECARLRARGLT